MLEVATNHLFSGDNTAALLQFQPQISVSNNRQYHHLAGLPTTKIMLAPEPPGLSPLETIYMDDQLRFYEQESGKISYGDLQPIIFETNDQMPPSTPQDLLSPRQFSFEDIGELEAEKPWQFRAPEQWQSGDVIDWIIHWATQNRVDLLEVNMLIFNTLTGRDLCRMSRQEFIAIDNQYGGVLYDSLQYLIAQYNAPTSITDGQLMTTDQDLVDEVEWERCVRWNNVFVDAQGPSSTPGYSGCDSDRESASSTMSTVNDRPELGMIFNSVGTRPFTKQLEAPTICVKKVGRRGRPPKKDGKIRGKGTGKLWEFIRDLLLNPATNPSMIRWERREDGIFKFVQSDKVARLWGDRKQNPRMTYEKLSRAMRYYYKSQVLLPVFGRRLVYKFGPNATGWRPVMHPPHGM